jgi:hypothetical protein
VRTPCHGYCFIDERQGSRFAIDVVADQPGETAFLGFNGPLNVNDLPLA